MTCTHVLYTRVRALVLGITSATPSNPTGFFYRNIYLVWLWLFSVVCLILARFTFIRIKRPDDWILFNDAKVFRVGFDEMVQGIEKSSNRCAYMLFYQRVGVEQPTLRALPTWVQEIAQNEMDEFVQGDLEKRTSRFFRDFLRRAVISSD